MCLRAVSDSVLQLLVETNDLCIKKICTSFTRTGDEGYAFGARPGRIASLILARHVSGSAKQHARKKKHEQLQHPWASSHLDDMNMSNQCQTQGTLVRLSCPDQC